ncbi:hypothetical protein L596_009562 [Steinernema carpocapsae]|uniref:Secreted protein n=1 Tax=Steinernema carpocapsae TaxID=34508 RepID=A0A4U5PG80_STECR|nr:hypothetical protein L596_009562 [Steinernema carpocapsae]
MHSYLVLCLLLTVSFFQNAQRVSKRHRPFIPDRLASGIHRSTRPRPKHNRTTPNATGNLAGWQRSPAEEERRAWTGPSRAPDEANCGPGSEVKRKQG